MINGNTSCVDLPTLWRRGLDYRKWSEMYVACLLHLLREEENSKRIAVSFCCSHRSQLLSKMHGGVVLNLHIPLFYWNIEMGTSVVIYLSDHLLVYSSSLVFC